MLDPLFPRLRGARLAMLLGPILLGACGETRAPEAASAVPGEVTELVIACRHDAALARLDSAEAAGDGSTSANELQRVIVLREAGRTMDAARVLRIRNGRDDVSADEAVYSGTAVENGLEAIRSERAARTGSRACR